MTTCAAHVPASKHHHARSTRSLYCRKPPCRFRKPFWDILAERLDACRQSACRCGSTSPLYLQCVSHQHACVLGSTNDKWLECVRLLNHERRSIQHNRGETVPCSLCIPPQVPDLVLGPCIPDKLQVSPNVGLGLRSRLLRMMPCLGGQCHEWK